MLAHELPMPPPCRWPQHQRPHTSHGKFLGGGGGGIFPVCAQVLKDLKSIVKSADRSIMSPVGLGLNFRVIGMDAGFR
jgi:hypothetical protein